MHCHFGTNKRAPRWTFTDPYKPEVRPGAREEWASPAWPATAAMNALRHNDIVYSTLKMTSSRCLRFDKHFRDFCGKGFPAVGISMGTNYAPLLTDIFLYPYETEFIHYLLSTCRKQLASRFNFTYRYIDNVWSINNPEFENNLGQMYPVVNEIKDTTGSDTSASDLDLLLSIGRDSPLHTSIYDKRDDINFHITVYQQYIFHSWVAIYQVRWPMVSLSHNLYDMPGRVPLMGVLFWGRQGYVKERLKLPLKTFHGTCVDLIKKYEVHIIVKWPNLTFYWLMKGFKEHLRRV